MKTPQILEKGTKASEVATTTGSTTLWGHLVEVDEEETPKTVLMLADGTLFSAQVTSEIVAVIRIEGLLGQDIGLRGEATWRLADWSLVGFTAHEIAEYRQGKDLVQSFRDLAEASKGRWMSVDPVKHVNELRNGDA